MEGTDVSASEGKPFVNTECGESHGRFSPDNRFFTDMSDASGRREIYVRPFSPDGKASGRWMISTNGGSQPRWSRDGKELFYISADSKLMAVPVSTAPVFRPGLPAALFTVPIGGYLTSRNWDVAPDGKKFLFVVNAADARSEPIVIVQNWQAELKTK